MKKMRNLIWIVWIFSGLQRKPEENAKEEEKKDEEVVEEPEPEPGPIRKEPIGDPAGFIESFTKSKPTPKEDIHGESRQTVILWI